MSRALIASLVGSALMLSVHTVAAQQCSELGCAAASTVSVRVGAVLRLSVEMAAAPVADGPANGARVFSLAARPAVLLSNVDRGWPTAVGPTDGRPWTIDVRPWLTVATDTLSTDPLTVRFTLVAR